MQRTLRVVDRAIFERHSRPSGLPLMLAAPAECHSPFRKVSHNPFLMAEGLQVNPEALTAEQLRAQAWGKIEPLYLERLAGLVESYGLAAARRQGSDELAKVAAAAIEGRVDTLLVEADREVPGRIDPETGRIEPGDLSHPETGDLLDDLSVTVFRKRGTVVVVPPDRMPSATGAAATFRF
jgi:hypothetical protein